MDKRLAQDILKDFDFHTMETLNTWIDYRINVLRFITESVASTTDQIRFAQGCIDELKVLKRIRDTAVKMLEE